MIEPQSVEKLYAALFHGISFISPLLKSLDKLPKENNFRFIVKTSKIINAYFIGISMAFITVIMQT